MCVVKKRTRPANSKVRAKTRKSQAAGTSHEDKANHKLSFLKANSKSINEKARKETFDSFVFLGLLIY
jgi:hypothetical protein